MRQADGVIAGVDEVHRAGDAGAEVREVVERGTTDVGQFDIAAQRRGLARDAVHVRRAAVSTDRRSYTWRAPPITAPARVRIGPGEIALTRTPCGPRSAAR